MMRTESQRPTKSKSPNQNTQSNMATQPSPTHPYNTRSKTAAQQSLTPQYTQSRTPNQQTFTQKQSKSNSKSSSKSNSKSQSAESSQSHSNNYSRPADANTPSASSDFMLPSTYSFSQSPSYSPKNIPPPPDRGSPNYIPYVAGGVLLLLLCCMIAMMKRHEKKKKKGERLLDSSSEDSGSDHLGTSSSTLGSCLPSWCNTTSNDTDVEMGNKITTSKTMESLTKL